MNRWRCTASMAARTLVSFTPCLATLATIALRTASETIVVDPWPLEDTLAGANGLFAVGAAGRIGNPEDCVCRDAFKVAVCGVATRGLDDERTGSDLPEREVFSDSEDNDNGKRLVLLSVMPAPFSDWPVERYASGQSATA